METLNFCLEVVVGWNKPKLNPAKMEVLLVGSSLVLGSGYIPRLEAVILIPKSPLHNLGVLLRPASRYAFGCPDSSHGKIWLVPHYVLALVTHTLVIL